MVGSRIKGITIEIDGSTVGLQKALSAVTNQSNKLQSELRDTERLLKFNPGNITLMAQRQKILTDQIAATTSKLNQLKSAQSQVDAQFKKGTISESQYRGFQREVVNTEQRLRDLDGKLKTTNAEFANNGKMAGKLSQDYKKSFDEAKKSSDNTFNSLKSAGKTVTVAGAGMAAGLGLVVKSAADFDQAMANAYSVMSPDEVNKFKGSLQDLAIQMGAKTKYSATEAASGIEELLKAGVSVTDVIHGGLEGALNLATAGDLDLADAAQIASTALNAFKNDNLSVAQAADILAGAANASATDVSELQFGLSAVSAVASGVGWSFKDTTTALAEFAQNGLRGQDAGTSLKTMLLNLQPATDKAAAQMKDLGIITKNGSNLFIDAHGKFKNLSDVSQILKDKLSGLTMAQQQQALKTMFGTDAVRAANIMMHEGAKGAGDMAAAMGKVSAADVAAQKMNTFSGAIEQLKGSLETAGISLGKALLPALKVVVQVVQSVVDGFNRLSPGLKSFIAISAAVVAALLLIVGPVLILIGMLPALAAGFGVLAGPVGAIIGIVAGVIAAIVGLTVAIIANWGNIKAMTIAVWTAIATFLSGVWTGIKNVVMTVWNAIGGFFQTISNVFQTIFTTTWNAISGAVSAVVTALSNTVRSIFSALGSALIPIWNGIKTVASGAWTLIKNVVLGPVLLLMDLVTGDFSSMGSHLSQIWNNIKGAAGAIWNGIKAIFSGVVNAIRGIVFGGFNGIRSIVSGVMGVIRSIISGAWNGVRSAVSWAVNGIRGAVSGAFNAVRSSVSGAMSGVWHAVQSGWSRAVGFLRSINLGSIGRHIIDGLVNGIRGAMGAIGNVIGSIASSIPDGIKRILHIHSPSRVLAWIGQMTGQGLVNGISGMISSVSSAAGQLANAAIPSIPSVNAPSINQATVSGATSGAPAQTLVGDGFTISIRNFNNYSSKDIQQLMQEAAFYARRRVPAN